MTLKKYLTLFNMSLFQIAEVKLLGFSLNLLYIM